MCIRDRTMNFRSLTLVGILALTGCALVLGGDLNCGTDETDFLAINVTNPTVIKVKVKTCDADMCQGNPLKPNAYVSCGGPDDRVTGKTSKMLHFNSNVTYFVFSNGVGVKEFHKPKEGGWPADYRINVPGAPNAWAESCPGCSANPTKAQCELIHGCCRCCAIPNPCAVM
eukprot:TRINITY_DN3179_c0_g1_i3.p1 TRINITY_DN3179_c0_g1~~TRINITY_DN3179_c0_g1_i3.p1  ORF type:complete len:171 (-),score=48.98 TRINITY_DN3179_c0_g1_i3:233-745(-)